MLTSFEAYAKRVNSDMAYMKSNVTALAEDNEDQDGKHDDLKRKYETMEYTTKTMKSDVTELTTKMYNSCVKSDHPSVHICQKQPEKRKARKTHKLVKSELKKIKKKKKRRKGRKRRKRRKRQKSL